MTATLGQQVGSSERRIGTIGTGARILGGVAMVGSVVEGHVSEGFHPWAWILGLAVFPAVALGSQWWRARRGAGRLHAVGPVAHLVNIAVFLALYLSPWSATSDAALLFYGASMLVAAARGYAGCEVLAVSNWLLRRDDQIGCAVYGPIDQVEAAYEGRRHRR
jgi:hypothetical protein